MTDCLHTENADDTEVRKRTLWENVNHRNLNGCPQADGGGERQLENKYPQMSQMDTDGGPQADDGGEQQLSKIGQQLKGNY